MQLYGFDQPQQLDMTQAYMMPGQEYMNVGTDLQELSTANPESDYAQMNNLVALQEDPEMEEMFFKKIGNWFKKAGKTVSKGFSKAIPVVKDVFKHTGKALGMVSDVAGKASSFVPDKHQGTFSKFTNGLNTASKVNGAASGFANNFQNLEQVGGYTADELMSLHSYGFDLNELFADDMTPELHELFYNKMGRHFKKFRTAIKEKRDARKEKRAERFGKVRKAFKTWMAKRAAKKEKTTEVEEPAATAELYEDLQQLDEVEELEYEPEELIMLLDEDEFDLAELEDFDEEMQQMFLKKVGNWIKENAPEKMKNFRARIADKWSQVKDNFSTSKLVKWLKAAKARRAAKQEATSNEDQLLI